ncbi:23S rRNA (uracil(1939)-C(5))-methyltransferase RlmD [Bacteroidota bacterium]
MTKRGKIIEGITIRDYAAEARCVARVDDLVLFVEYTAPGDVVDVRITRHKKSYLEARPVKFHSYSERRSDPFCSHFGECGGCKWQHVSYNDQLTFKRQQVIDQFERLGKFIFPEVEPTIGSSSSRYYRNKLDFTFSDRRWLTFEEINNGGDLDRNGLGFHKPGQFDKVLDIEQCYLQPEPSNKIRTGIKKFSLENNIPFYNLVDHTGFLRNLIIRTSNTGGVMVILQVASELPEFINLAMEYLKNTFQEITSLNYVVNPKGNETFFDLEVINYYGDPYIIEEMEGLEFRIGPKSFYQTNSQQAYQLYKTARDFAQLKNTDIVYDLYTGTGTIANFIAGQVNTVIGIDNIEEAIKDAVVNAETNGIDNVRFIPGDMKNTFTAEFVEKNGHPDVIITDPPRAGMHSNVVETLLDLSPGRIVYISCNPATQARDIGILAGMYEVKKVQPLDMFPHTHHIENIVLLERTENE